MLAYMNKKDVRDIGHKFKAYREDVGLSQLEVATKLGYSSAQYVSNIERGLSAPPADKLGKFVKIFRLNGRQAEEIKDDLVACFTRYLNKHLK